MSSKELQWIIYQWLTSLGSANIPTMAVSIASWFSSLEAWAAIKTTVSASTPFAKTLLVKTKIIRKFAYKSKVYQMKNTKYIETWYHQSRGSSSHTLHRQLKRKDTYQKMSTWYLPVTAYTLLKLAQTHSQVFQYQ